jgi:hypothetical protein
MAAAASVMAVNSTKLNNKGERSANSKSPSPPGTARVLRQPEISNRQVRNPNNRLGTAGYESYFSVGSKSNAYSTERGTTNLLLSQAPAYSNELVVACNKQAMTALSTENYKECQAYLKRAEAMVEAMLNKIMALSTWKTHTNFEPVSKLYSLTMNNLGCYYKK